MDDVTREQIRDAGPNIRVNPLLAFIKHRFFAPSLYAISGGLLLYSLIIIFYTYVLRLKVESAVVSTQIETIVAPAGGYITDVFVQSGDHVKKGVPLLKIENINLERRLQLARVQVEESRLNIDYYQQLLANEQQRLNVYKKIGHTRVVSALSLVNVSKKKVMIAQHNLERYINLHKKQYVSEADLEAKRVQYENALEQLKNVEAQQRLEHHSLNAVKKGMYFTGTKAEGVERDLLAELLAAQKKATLNDNRVKIYENLVGRLTLVAPFDGIVTQVLKSAGNTTDSVKPIIFIEKSGMDKKIIAFLTQDEVIHIGASGKVRIYIPSSGRTYHGKIIEINRTDGFIDVVKAQYQWRDFQVDRSAMVTIALQDNEQNAFDKQAFSGMPVVVYFSKKWAFF